MSNERITHDRPEDLIPGERCGGLDEVWLRGVDVHLERMDDGHIWIGVYRDGADSRVDIHLYTRRNALIVGRAEFDGPAWPGVEEKP